MNRNSRLREAEKRGALLRLAPPRMRNLKGRPLEKVMAIVKKAVRPNFLPVLEEIYRQAEVYSAQWPREAGHGFIQWLKALQEGRAPLPPVIPNTVIVAWRDGHRHRPGENLLRPIILCQRCRMVLPNATPVHLNMRFFDRCPVCRGNKFFNLELSPPRDS